MKNLKYILFSLIVFFMSLANAKALSCTYSSGNTNFVCTISSTNVDCKFSNINADYSKLDNKLRPQMFVSSNMEIDCNEVKTIYVDMIATKSYRYKIFSISRNNNGCPLSIEEYNNNIKDYRGTKAPSGCGTFKLSSSNNDDNKNNGNNNNTAIKGDSSTSKNDINASKNPSNGISTDPSEGLMETEYFCQGNVLAVFRVLGWIIIIIKILVPILLIAFGSIDFGKAVISSKSDEIPKTIKTLTIRCIAGIVIFFIPSFIYLLIEVIGGEDIFNKNSGRNDNSQFGACTYCLFHPEDDTCETIKN